MEKKLEPEKLARVKQILETNKVSSPSSPKNIGPKSLKFLSSAYLRISLTLVLFLLIFVITFTTAYFNAKKRQQTSAQNIVPESEIVLPTGTQENETTNWKTLENKDIGFSTKYPADWNYRIVQSPTSEYAIVEIFKDDVGQLSIYKLTESPTYVYTLEEWYQSLATPKIPFGCYGCQGSYTKRSEIEIDDVKGIELTYPGEHVVLREMRLPIDGAIMAIDVRPSEIYEQSDVQSIISNFKFLDQKVQGITTSISCLETEAKMLQEISECEIVSEKVCLELKSEFDDCMNDCQKELEKNFCFDICKPVCNNTDS